MNAASETVSRYGAYIERGTYAIWSLGAWFGGLGFALGIAGAVMYDRMVSAKRKPVYTIFGYPEHAGAVRKGDNEFD